METIPEVIEQEPVREATPRPILIEEEPPPVREATPRPILIEEVPELGIEGGLTEAGRRRLAEREAAAALAGGLTPEGRERLEDPKVQEQVRLAEEAAGADIAKTGILRDKDIVVSSDAQLQGAQDFLSGKEAEQILLEKEEVRIEVERGGLTELGKQIAATPEREALTQTLEEARGKEKARTALLQGKDITVATDAEAEGAQKFIDSKAGQKILLEQAEERRKVSVGGLTEIGEAIQGTPEAQERIRKAQQARGADIAKAGLLRDQDILVTAGLQEKGAKEFISSEEGQKILQEQAEAISGGLTKAGRERQAAPAIMAGILGREEARGAQKAKNFLLQGKEGEIIVRSPAEEKGAAAFLKAEGLLGEPEPVKTTAPTTVLPIPKEKTFLEKLEGTFTGTILTEAERQKALAESRRKGGNIIGAILAGAAGELLSLEAGAVAAGESLFELVGGKDVPDIGGALIGSGIESALSGEIRETPEAVFLKTNPVFAAGAVLGEIIIGVGVGTVLKTAGIGAAKGAQLLSRVGAGTRARKVTEAPIRLVERLGIGGARAEKITTVTQKGVIRQVPPGRRFADVTTQIRTEPTKLTFREARELKRFAGRAEPISIEAVGKEFRVVAGKRGKLISRAEGTFDIGGEAVKARLKGAKKFDVVTGRPAVKVKGKTLADDLINISTDTKFDPGKVAKDTTEALTAGTRKTKPIRIKENLLEQIREKDRFQKELKQLRSPIEGKRVGKVPAKRLVGEEELALFPDTTVETIADVVSGTRKIKKGRVTVISKQITIRGAPSTEKVIKVQRTAKAVAIVSKKLPQADDVFKGSKDFKPPTSGILRLGDDLVIKKGGKIVDPKEVGLIKKAPPVRKGKAGRPLTGGQFGITESAAKTATRGRGLVSKAAPILPGTVRRAGAGVRAGLGLTAAGRIIGGDKIVSSDKVSESVVVTTADVTARKPDVKPRKVVAKAPTIQETIVTQKPLIDVTQKQPTTIVTEQPIIDTTQRQPIRQIIGVTPKIGVTEIPKARPIIDPITSPITTPGIKPPRILPGEKPGVKPGLRPPKVIPDLLPDVDIDVARDIIQTPRLRQPQITRQPPLLRLQTDLETPRIFRTPPPRIKTVKRPPLIPILREEKRRKRRFGRDRFGRKRFENPLASVEQVLNVGQRRTRKKDKGKSLGNLNFF